MKSLCKLCCVYVSSVQQSLSKFQGVILDIIEMTNPEKFVVLNERKNLFWKKKSFLKSELVNVVRRELHLQVAFPGWKWRFLHHSSILTHYWCWKSLCWCPQEHWFFQRKLNITQIQMWVVSKETMTMWCERESVPRFLFSRMYSQTQIPTLAANKRTN